MSSYTETDKWECAERELRYRARVYTRLVESGKMSRQKAQHELELMAAIVEDYKIRAAGERLL